VDVALAAMCPNSCLWMALLSKTEVGISNLRHSILKSSSVIARTSAMVRCVHVVVTLTEKSVQMHTANATNHNLHGLATITRPNRYWEGTKIEI